MFDELEDDLYTFAIQYFDPWLGDWVTVQCHEYPDPMIQMIPCDDEPSE